MRGKNLDGDGAVQACVARAVNFAHASRAEGRNNLVWPESSASGQCHGGVDYIPSNQALEITLAFATEEQISAAETPIHKGARSGRRDGPGCYLAWSLQRL